MAQSKREQNSIRNVLLRSGSIVPRSTTENKQASRQAAIAARRAEMNRNQPVTT
ncbi:MAG: hypothetical protein QX203_13165 [Methylococcaceae bacterium]